jgi:bisphosphoglycerate-independent phosphoglycerate mutase (AlkP superfamily)
MLWKKIIHLLLYQPMDYRLACPSILCFIKFSGLMGNSEVGHLNIGAGRIVYQDIVRIELAIKNNTLCSQKAVVDAFNRAKSTNGRLHLLGLVSDGNMHYL